MAGDIGLSVSARELEKLSKKLKSQRGGQLQRRLRSEIAGAARPVEGRLRTAAAGVRVTSSRGGVARPDKSSGLRQRLAGAVDTRLTARGVRFVVEANRVDERYGASLSRYSDGELRQWRRWRHPVFGNRENWQNQTGSPWFFVTVRKHQAAFEKAVGKAIDAVLKDISS